MKPSTDHCGIVRGITRFLLWIQEIRKMTFRKVPRVQRAHRSYPIIVLILEKTITCEGETRNAAYLIRAINGSLNRSNSNRILNQTRINKSSASILNGSVDARALHGECRNKGMSNIYSAWAYIGVGEGKGRRGDGAQRHNESGTAPDGRG